MRNPMFFASLAGMVAILASVQGCGDSASNKPVPTKESANSIIDTKMSGAKGAGPTKAK